LHNRSQLDGTLKESKEALLQPDFQLFLGITLVPFLDGIFQDKVLFLLNSLERENQILIMLTKGKRGTRGSRPRRGQHSS
jgi:hypothetical protein